MFNKYKEERVEVVKTSGGIPSKWPFYSRCDQLWLCSPKGANIPNAINNEVQMPFRGVVVNLDDHIDLLNLNDDCFIDLDLEIVRCTQEV